MSASLENETLCNGLAAYNRGSALSTVRIDECPFIYFKLLPSPAAFQPYVGVSIRIPPLIDKLTFSYYSTGIAHAPPAVAFRFTYSNVCDNAVDAVLGLVAIVPPLACPILNATTERQVTQRFLTPSAAGLPDAMFLNIVLLNVPADAVIYMGQFYYRVVDGPIIELGPCPTHDMFQLALCTCNHHCEL
jgi:hypothetical protein